MLLLDDLPPLLRTEPGRWFCSWLRLVSPALDAGEMLAARLGVLKTT